MTGIGGDGPAGGHARVAWVTNIASPYRLPLWAAVARSVELRVFCMARREPNRNWQIDLSQLPVPVTVLDAPAVRPSAELSLYLPTPRLRAVFEADPQVVLLDGWESPAYLAILAGARRRGIATVLFYRSTLASHRFRGGPVAAVRSRVFRSVDAVLTAGTAATAAVTAMGVAPERIVTSVNVVDVARYATARSRRDPAPRAGHAYLYVGQLIRRKNVTALIQAFSTIAAPADTLTIVGTGPLETELRTAAATSPAANRITFRGHLEGQQLLDAYAAADTLVLPSTEEVWGLVVNEALAAGLHTVVSRACGVAPDITGMPGVHLTDPDPASLATALTTSRTTWTGPIPDPPITTWTPQRLATDTTKAITLAQATRGR